jgi:hypothetical protein
MGSKLNKKTKAVIVSAIAVGVLHGVKAMYTKHKESKTCKAKGCKYMKEAYNKISKKF